MKALLKKPTILSLCTLLCIFSSKAQADNSNAELISTYSFHHLLPSDINEHLPVIRRFAQDCSSAVEIGVRTMVSTWGILLGLSEGPHHSTSYLGIDMDLAPPHMLNLATKLASKNGISYKFWQANDMDVDIPVTDLLLIDTLHTYGHLSYELEKFNSNVMKYIIMHDTSGYFESNNCGSYTGDYSEYPKSISRTKKGLWPAVVDFLAQHPEWSLQERHLNNNGLTVLKRNN